jgi:hypothetical protein
MPKELVASCRLPAEGETAMNLLEFLESRHKAEYPKFLKVLKAPPAERFDYRPHDRSPSAAEIVWTLARETKACCELIESGQVNWTPQPAPADPQAILSAFQNSMRRWAGVSAGSTKAPGRTRQSFSSTVNCFANRPWASFCGICFSTPSITAAS